VHVPAAEAECGATSSWWQKDTGVGGAEEDVRLPAKWTEQLMLKRFAPVLPGEFDLCQELGERDRIAGCNVVV
jgi:hypothetical protein